MYRGYVSSAAMALVAALAPPPASAQGNELYSVTVIVTGRDNLAERARGIGHALPLVLTKVSVDADVANRASQRGLLADSHSFVASLDYRDRKEGVQISDEQGTRDRSFELTVRFNPARIDAVLAELGVKPWRQPRPAIGVELTISDGVSRYLLTEASEKGYGQRMALADKAKALGLSASLPKAADVELDTAVKLEGEMSITAGGYWTTQWRIIAPDVADDFALTGTTFDVSIGEALQRTAKAIAAR